MRFNPNPDEPRVALWFADPADSTRMREHLDERFANAAEQTVAAISHFTRTGTRNLAEMIELHDCALEHLAGRIKTLEHVQRPPRPGIVRRLWRFLW